MKHFDLEFENSLRMAEKRAYLSDIIPSSEMQLWNNKNLVVIQIWHALGSLKKFGYSSLDKNDGRNEPLFFDRFYHN